MTTRVGLFGRLGSGNIGNDGTLEAVLGDLRERQPQAQVDCMCSGPDVVTERYAIPATRLHWLGARTGFRRHVPGLPVTAFMVLAGIVIDAYHTAAWVRRHDVVIVPGMGSLEATLTERPWQMPWSLFLLSLSGRIYGTRVAMVGVGATYIPDRVNRFLMTSAARLAGYRSFRDAYSRAEMQRMGLAAHDEVCPDLVFSMPVPEDVVAAPGTIGVGVMAYRGANQDRAVAEGIYSTYVDAMIGFVVGLTERGHRVRLFLGDSEDDPVANEVADAARLARPHLPPDALVIDPAETLTALMEGVAGVEVMVAARYHNVVCALACATPTLAIAYGIKHDVLMEDIGMPGMSQPIRDLDVDCLLDQFVALYDDRVAVAARLRERRDELAHRVDLHFADMSRQLFGCDTTRDGRLIV
jgi:polysaccharide pyruvyl transferase WcaK-like protein